MRLKDIYLDSGASTQVDPKVVKAMEDYFEKDYGNASSTHTFGQSAKDALERSREIIAKSINAHPDEIIFTSGGTESNNFVLRVVGEDADALCPLTGFFSSFKGDLNMSFPSRGNILG